MDITQLILDDHHEQRRLFSIIEQIAAADTESLAAVWGRLSTFLEVHAAAEEKIFYPELLRVGLSAAGGGSADTAEAETLDAIHDHNDIRDSIAAVAGHPVGSSDWLAAIAAVNVANGDHMAEEEREGLTDFRRRASLRLRHDLAVAFAVFEAGNYTGVAPVDRDPETYVHDEELGIPRSPRLADPAGTSAPDSPGGTSPSPDGSLNIGSLRGAP